MRRKRALFESLLAITAILLIFSFYLMVTGYAFTTTETRATVEWDASGNGTIYYLTACPDGTLRALMDGRISAIGSDGASLWIVDIPDKWWMGSKYFRPAVDVGPDGTLYVYLRANVTSAAMERKLPYRYSNDGYLDMDDQNRRLMAAYSGTEFARSLDERVLAISPGGDVLWNLPLSTGLYDADIKARNDTVYVFHGSTETVLDRQGRRLWSVEDVGAAPAIDESGYVYTVEPVYGGAARGELSGIVRAYYPNGTAYWRRDIGEPAFIQTLRDGASPMPLYDHGTLYVPLSNGVAALDKNGSVKWVKHYGVSTALFELAPFDGDGNVYLRCFNEGVRLNEYTFRGETFYAYPEDYGSVSLEGSGLSILAPDGSVLSGMPDPTRYVYAADGIAYRAELFYPQTDRSMDVLEFGVLTARDLRQDRTLWSYRFWPAGTGTALVNGSNVNSLLMADDAIAARAFNAAPENVSAGGIVDGDCGFRIIQGRDVTYVGFWTYNYESPAVYGHSRATYGGGLYAFDRSGKLLWYRPLDSIIGSMYEKDGTVFYSTGSGRMSAARVDVISGLAMAAALYLLIRFIAVGAISRARGAIGKNENRNAVLKYVNEHPGSTMYEVSRSLAINKGTVRYHLFILTVNHRITSLKADKKFVRYFPNSNSFSKAEQRMMSLLRRDPIRRVMEALLRKPDLSNVELSKELNVPESAMSKHMKELCTSGLVDKRSQDGGVSYRIKDELAGPIRKALDLTGG